MAANQYKWLKLLLSNNPFENFKELVIILRGLHTSLSYYTISQKKYKYIKYNG